MNGHTWWWKTRRKKALAAERPRRGQGITPDEMTELRKIVDADPLGEWVECPEGDAEITFVGSRAMRALCEAEERHASGTHEGVGGDRDDEN